MIYRVSSNELGETLSSNMSRTDLITTILYIIQAPGEHGSRAPPVDRLLNENYFIEITRAIRHSSATAHRPTGRQKFSRKMSDKKWQRKRRHPMRETDQNAAQMFGRSGIRHIDGETVFTLCGPYSSPMINLTFLLMKR